MKIYKRKDPLNKETAYYFLLSNKKPIKICLNDKKQIIKIFEINDFYFEKESKNIDLYELIFNETLKNTLINNNYIINRFLEIKKELENIENKLVK